eukprot:m.37900 g.37900  ORF g.37900 m.37900 type:complete len:87 (-) comp12553_c0_seq4:257-517(-)
MLDFQPLYIAQANVTSPNLTKGRKKEEITFRLCFKLFHTSMESFLVSMNLACTAAHVILDSDAYLNQWFGVEDIKAVVSCSKQSRA